MCIPHVPPVLALVWLFGFAFFAFLPWPNESFGERLAQGLIVPTFVVGVVLLLFG
jgi:hypothetical protein